ncbi:ATP-binding protein [Lacrimispora sp.]|uniref:ATP-binding protein n=1 Tax=Lacrimispora sp. TaxID=2719234 RepID=UPI003FA5F4E1
MSNILIKFIKQLKGDVHNDVDKCLYCGKCAKKCRPKAITVNHQTNEWIWNTEKCVRCGHCVDACPAKSLCLRK